MAKPRKRRRTRKSNPFGRRRRRRANPKIRYRLKNSHRSHRRRRRNPGGSTSDLVVTAASAVAGGVATRAIPQAVLPNYNSGFIGYGLNAVVAFGGGWAIEKFGHAPRAAFGWKIGGIVMIIGRAIEQFAGKQVVEFGSLSGLGYKGDAGFDFRLRGLGAKYGSSYTPQPTSSTITNGLMISSSPVAALPPAAAVSKAKTMSGLRYNPNWGNTRFRGRFAA